MAIEYSQLCPRSRWQFKVNTSYTDWKVELPQQVEYSTYTIPKEYSDNWARTFYFTDSTQHTDTRLSSRN